MSVIRRIATSLINARDMSILGTEKLRKGMMQKMAQTPNDWVESLFGFLSFRDKARVRDWALRNMSPNMTLSQKNDVIFRRLYKLAESHGLLDVFYNERAFAQLLIASTLTLE